MYFMNLQICPTSSYARIKKHLSVLQAIQREVIHYDEGFNRTQLFVLIENNYFTIYYENRFYFTYQGRSFTPKKIEPAWSYSSCLRIIFFTIKYRWHGRHTYMLILNTDASVYTQWVFEVIIGEPYLLCLNRKLVMLIRCHILILLG